MSAVWFVPLHGGLAGHDWLLQAAVILLIAGLWRFLAGAIERRTARRRQPPRTAGRLDQAERPYHPG